jgi:predicted GH43/DUF377 family glycosyl hydrolase
MFPAIEHLPEFICRVEPAMLQPGHRHYNPSICRFQGRLLMAYRVQAADGFSRLGIAELNDDFSVWSDRPLSFPGAIPPLHIEDPRLFTAGGRLYINFCEIDYSPPWEKCVFLLRLFELGADLSPLRELPLRFGRNGRRTEKNWIFFEGPEGDIRIIHSLAPKHTAIDYERKLTIQSPGIAAWPYGSLSGRSTAVRMDADNYLCMVGGHQPHAERKAIYWMGACTFSAQWPHRLTGITQEPLAWASAESMTILNPQNRGWHPLCIFPSGLMVERNAAIVAMGVNDSWSALLRYPLDGIRARLVPPDSLPRTPDPLAAATALPVPPSLVRVRVVGHRTIHEAPLGVFSPGQEFNTTPARAAALGPGRVQILTIDP